ncbi:hypothetical protein [Kocuria sp. CPCC 205263]|uniref:hypothetical protein n=1 Tax=Kocuria sp. CPCC 205263 TaxID=3073555 RepID=UPI0034D58B38
MALAVMAHGSWRGDWLIVTLNAVIVAIAVWGLRLPRKQADDSHQFPAADRLVTSSPGSLLAPSTKETSHFPCPQPSPHAALIDSTTTESPEELPVLASFAITDRIDSAATGTTGRLTVIIPADTEVTTDPVVAALLTAGHQILDEHHLTDQPLLTVEISAVERADKQPATIPATGFTVHITNDLTARQSDITLDAHQTLGTDNRVLLIAATLLAGAEHLLDYPARSLPTRPSRTHRGRGHRRRHPPRPEPAANRPYVKRKRAEAVSEIM